MGNYIFLIFFTFGLFSIYCDDVEIEKPYSPLYIETSNNLTLVCRAGNRMELEWVRNTPSTGWRDTDVVATANSDFIIRNLQEEPSGLVESTLIKKNMQLEDRGTYLCRDKVEENGFAAWVTVLKVFAQNITARHSDEVVLHCNISGFDTNRPYIVYSWYHEDWLIPEGHEHFETSLDGSGHLALKIKQPGRQDHGVYNCSFILGTSIGPLTVSTLVHLNASHLEISSGSRSALSMSLLGSLFLWTLLALNRDYH